MEKAHVSTIHASLLFTAFIFQQNYFYFLVDVFKLKRNHTFISPLYLSYSFLTFLTRSRLWTFGWVHEYSLIKSLTPAPCCVQVVNMSLSTKHISTSWHTVRPTYFAPATTPVSQGIWFPVIYISTRHTQNMVHHPGVRHSTGFDNTHAVLQCHFSSVLYSVRALKLRLQYLTAEAVITHSSNSL